MCRKPAVRPPNRLSRMPQTQVCLRAWMRLHSIPKHLVVPQVVYEGDGGDIVTAEEQRQRKSRYLKLKVGSCMQLGLCRLIRVEGG